MEIGNVPNESSIEHLSVIDIHDADAKRTEVLSLKLNKLSSLYVFNKSTKTEDMKLPINALTPLLSCVEKDIVIDNFTMTKDSLLLFFKSCSMIKKVTIKNCKIGK